MRNALGTLLLLGLFGCLSRETSAEKKDTPAVDKTRVAYRILNREYPSVFQAWNPADNLKDEDPRDTLARHDLIWHGPGFFGLRWDRRPLGLAEGFTPESVKKAKAWREDALRRNPNLVIIVEIRYRDAHPGFLPEDHAWWMRDQAGKRVMGWKEGGYFRLDYRQAAYRRHVAAQCRAVVETGAVDGVMLDWWHDDDDRLALIREVRAAVGETALIIANANDRITPRTAPYINGYFMECYRSETAKDWSRIAATLSWAEKNLRTPRVNCLESWFHKSRKDLNLMRAVTALSLTHSDGYCLFSDPNPLPTPDHLHDWYPFWDRRLGRPLSPGAERDDGSTIRHFERGSALYNPMGNDSVRVTFPEPRTSLATGRRAETHTIDPADGDIYLKK